MFENWVLRKMLGLMDRVTIYKRIVFKEELYYFNYSPHSIQVIRSRKMGGACGTHSGD